MIVAMKRELKPSEIVIRGEILRRLAEGESLRKICRDAGFPVASTVLSWASEETESGGFGEQYARARQVGYALLADEIIEISDDSSEDLIIGERGESMNAEFVARSRLRVDSRKWMLSKMLPKVYGDKVAHEVGGIDGKPIQTESVNVVVPVDPVEASRLYLKTMENRG